MQELVVGFDPVGKFVDLLKHRFGHLGMFFSDQYGGDIIAIKWHSQVREFDYLDATPEDV